MISLSERWRYRGRANQPGVCLDDYLHHGGVLRPGQRLTGRTRPILSALVLARVTSGKNGIALIPTETRIIQSRDHFELNAPDDPGAYVLLGRLGDRKVGYTILVSAPASKIVVVRPSWTEWGYHNHGFYQNQGRTPGDWSLKLIESILPPARNVSRALRRAFPRRLLYPYRTPAHPSIDMSGFYEQNPRWRGMHLWNDELESIEGVWVEDAKSTWPLFAMLDSLGIQVSVASDFDLEYRSDILDHHQVCLFYAAELMTRSGFEWFRKVRAEMTPRVVFWGMQGLGLKEVEVDGEELKFTGHKGRMGLSGEVIKVPAPSWGDDDARVFGAYFPVPETPYWRDYFGELKIEMNDHPLAKILRGRKLKYELPGSCHPEGGLTAGGGEFFEASPGCDVVASLDGGRTLGIGVSGPFTHVSPTYWPAFGIYQPHAHKEVPELLKKILE